jgi:hypothetical protein
MAQSRSYSCEKTMMRQADWDIWELLAQFRPSSGEIYSCPNWELFVTPCYLYSKQIILITFISRDCISLQSLHQILIGRSECLRPPISRSLGRDFHSHLMSLACCTILLAITFLLLGIILIAPTYGYSKFAIQLLQYDDRYPFWITQP